MHTSLPSIAMRTSPEPELTMLSKHGSDLLQKIEVLKEFHFCWRFVALLSQYADVRHGQVIGSRDFRGLNEVALCNARCQPVEALFGNLVISDDMAVSHATSHRDMPIRDLPTGCCSHAATVLHMVREPAGGALDGRFASAIRNPCKPGERAESEGCSQPEQPAGCREDC
jgi:hypothetical protein